MSETQLDDLVNRVSRLEDLVKRQVNAPTLPKYDPTNPPQDAVEGQIHSGIDDQLYHFSNGLWHLASVFTPNTGGTWISYTPTWTETAGVQPSLGNGSLTGFYYQLGKFVVCTIKLIAGTTTTFGNSSNVWLFSLPVTAATASIAFGMSSNSSNAPNNVVTWGYQSDINHMAAWGYTPTGGSGLIQFMNSNQPLTWTSVAHINVSCLYEAA